MEPPVVDRKNVHAWCLYDWSTNGYQVTTASALLPVFFVQQVAPEGATILGKFFPPAALWGFGIGTAAIAVLLMAPILGAIADYTRLRKHFLVTMACGGSLFACLLFFSRPGTIWLSLGFFVLAQTCYTAGNVFYDSFLPHIVPDHLVDRTSGRGFAYGYVGGGVQFGLALLLIMMHEPLGLTREMAIRLALLSAGLWWIGFASYTFLHLRETEPPRREKTSWRDIPEAVHVGAGRTWQVIKRLPKFPGILLFLIAFLLYNDGIQTVIGISAAYGGAELRLSAEAIMITFLIVQFIAFAGAIGFARFADRVGAKAAIMTALAIWTGIVSFAYFLREGSVVGFFILGAFVGLVLGGSQALSRSLFASIIPKEATAHFFGFYSVFNKLSAVSGPLLFATLATAFGSARPAILALAAYFIVGMILLSRVDVDKARASRGLWRFHGAEAEIERDDSKMRT